MMHLLNCKEVTTRLALGDIRQYPWWERLVIRFHMVICDACRKYERQLKVIGKALGISIEEKRRKTDTADFQKRLINKLDKL